MALDNQRFEEELLPPPPKKKKAQQDNLDTGDFLPKPPIKKYTLLYYWHKFLNFFC